MSTRTVNTNCQAFPLFLVLNASDAAQELVGFLTENTEMAADHDELQVHPPPALRAWT